VTVPRSVNVRPMVGDGGGAAPKVPAMTTSTDRASETTSSKRRSWRTHVAKFTVVGALVVGASWSTATVSAHTPAAPTVAKNASGVCTVQSGNLSARANFTGKSIVLQYKSSTGVWTTFASRNSPASGSTLLGSEALVKKVYNQYTSIRSIEYATDGHPSAIGTCQLAYSASYPTHYPSHYPPHYPAHYPAHFPGGR
jgi:hypothetical protein